MSSTDHVKNIALVGATGQVGTFILNALIEKDMFNITAITRSGSGSSLPSSVKVSTISYDEPSTIVSALKGQDVLIITMAIAAPPDTQDKLIRAAAEAGVPWILPNEFGADCSNDKVAQDILVGVQKKKTNQFIESLGVSKWIGVTTNFWYEYSLSGPGFYGIDIRKREVVFFDEGKTKLSTTTWPQSGRAVANLLALPIESKDSDSKSPTLSSYGNKYVYVNSFSLTQHEMFDAVKRVTRTSDSDWSISSVGARERFEKAREQVLAGDRQVFPIMLYTRMFVDDGAGTYIGKPLDNKKLGLPEENLDEFTQKAVKMAEEDYMAKTFAAKH